MYHNAKKRLSYNFNPLPFKIPKSPVSRSPDVSIQNGIKIRNVSYLLFGYQENHSECHWKREYPSPNSDKTIFFVVVYLYMFGKAPELAEKKFFLIQIPNWIHSAKIWHYSIGTAHLTRILSVTKTSVSH